MKQILLPVLFIFLLGCSSGEERVISVTPESKQEEVAETTQNPASLKIREDYLECFSGKMCENLDEAKLSPEMKVVLKPEVQGSINQVYLEFSQNNGKSTVAPLLINGGILTSNHAIIYYTDATYIIVDSGEYLTFQTTPFYFYNGIEWNRLPIEGKIEEVLYKEEPTFNEAWWVGPEDVSGENPDSIDLSVSWNPTPETAPVSINVSFNVKTYEVKITDRHTY
ncbi:hypothetical protein IPG41_04685 [Candidatus Peregrinibacteria bacterium]|nr:MAG: hypothetical protein IPG41_04685 [Candidatus Peregrinibacteria bacterium]